MRVEKFQWPVRFVGGLCLLVAASVGQASASEISALERWDGLTVLEGDILTGPRLAMRGVGLAGGGRPWDDGIIPYVIDDKLDPDSQQRVQQAIERWNQISGISLRPFVDAERQGADHVHFQSGPGCASWVGRQGGMQEIWVAPSCTAGSIMHEIGHALGLEHEHIRADRDEYIQIHWKNIDPAKRHNFDVAPAGSLHFAEYDYASIMHYGTSNFSVNGKVTISPIDGVDVIIGQRETPSAGDLASVAAMYKSDIALSFEPLSDQFGQQVRFRVDNLYWQGAHELQLDFELPDPAATWSSDSPWQCLRESARWSCTLDRLSASTSSTLMLSMAADIDPLGLNARISSKTPDIDLANNGMQNGDNTVLSPESTPALGGARQALADGQRDSISDYSVFEDGSGGGALSWLAMISLLAFRLAGLRLTCSQRTRKRQCAASHKAAILRY